MIINPKETHERTKHIDIPYMLIRHHQQTRDIAVEYVPTEDQVADALTKPLHRDRLRMLRERLGMTEPPKQN